MALVIPPAIWNLIAIGTQTLFTRALLLLERGATKEEIQAHVAEMQAKNATANAELERLRQENP